VTRPRAHPLTTPPSPPPLLPFQGTYGRVYQVRHRSSQALFAMKVFEKEKLIKMKQVTYGLGVVSTHYLGHATRPWH
jgi:hypothetical protein